MLNPTTSGVDEKDDATTSVFSDNRMNTGMIFAEIVRGNKSSKSVTKVNSVIPAQKNQAAWFILAWWYMYLDSFATYHT